MKLPSQAVPAILLLALLNLPAAAGVPAAHWLEPIPAAKRASAVQSLRALLRAESRKDWSAVYQLRPELDRQTESEPEFTRRWLEISKDTVLDFQPERAVPSVFGSESDDEQVFDILGCAKVRGRDQTRFQSGSISAHLTSYGWALDGVHLMTDDDDKPEPCSFHTGAALLASGGTR
jgi:hypothetical protein